MASAPVSPFGAPINRQPSHPGNGPIPVSATDWLTSYNRRQRPTVSVSFAAKAVDAALAPLPDEVKQATLEQLEIDSLTRQVIDTAREQLSPLMYPAFLRWGEGGVDGLGGEGDRDRVHRGTPRKLPEDERRHLAMVLNVDERELGARDPWRPAGHQTSGSDVKPYYVSSPFS